MSEAPVGDEPPRNSSRMPTLMSSLSKIVLAWSDPDFEVVEERRRDLGESPKLRHFTTGKAAMWKSKISEKKLPYELAAAEKYASSEPTGAIKVFVYPNSEKDPLGRAKREVLSNSRPSLPPGSRKG